MLNDYKHLPNGLTCIWIKGGRKIGLQKLKAFINTEDFETVNKGTTEYWSLWNSDKTPSVNGNVNGKFIKLNRFITDIYGDRRQSVIHANGNPLDLRRENLIVTPLGSSNKESFKVSLKKIAMKLPPLPNEDEIASAEKEKEVQSSSGNPNTPQDIHIEKNIITNKISITVGGKKTILSSLNEVDAKALIGILRELNVYV